MPRVPIFDGVPTANLAPASAPMFGAPRSAAVPGDPGAQLQQAGQDMLRLGTQVAQRERQEMAKLSTAQAKSNYNELHGAIDSELNTLKGYKLDGAKNNKTIIEQNIKKHYDRIFQKMTDEDAREAFAQAAQGLMISTQSDIDNYVRIQNEEHQSEVSRVNQGLMERDAADAWVKSYEAAAHQDPTKIGPPVPPINGEQFERGAIGNINDEADRMGLPADSPIRAQKIAESRSRVNESVVEKLSAMGRFDAAEKHLADSISRGEFDPDLASKMQSRIRSRRIADGALKQVVAWDDQGVPMPERIGAARQALTDGKIDAESYKALIDEIGKSEKLNQEIEDSAKKDALAQAQQFLYNNKLASIEDFANANPKAYDAIVSTGGLPDLIAFSGKRIVTNPLARMKALTMPERELRAFTKAGIEVAFGTLLDEQDMNKLRARYAEATGAGSKEGTDIIGREKRLIRGFADVFKHKYPSLDINDSKALQSGDVAKDYDRFLNSLQERITTFEQSRADGKKATTEDIQKIIDGMKTEEAAKRMSMLGVDKAWSDSNVNVNAIEDWERELIYVPTPRGDVFLKDIPKSEEAAITRELNASAQKWIEINQAKGYDVSSLDVPAKYRPTPANVVRLWVGAGSPGAAPGSSGAAAAPEKLGPPAPSAEAQAGFSLTAPGSKPNMAEALANVRGGGAERIAERERRTKMRDEINKKHGAPEFRVWHLWAPDPKQIAADEEFDREWQKITNEPKERAYYKRLVDDTPARRAAMEQLRSQIDILTKEFGKNSPIVAPMERHYQDLELVELKMQSMRAQFEESDK